MVEVKPLVAAQLFSGLVGRNVGFTQVTVAPASKAKQIYGEYILKPTGMTSVVQLDLLLLGSLGAAMLGLPAGSVAERLNPPFDESLRDAMHEILNVTSTIVSLDSRAVFQKMNTDKTFLSQGALDTVSSPLGRSYFMVNVDGYDGGAFTILTP